MATLFLIAVIAGTEVAISSDSIESVVTLGDVVKVPQCDPLVAGLIAIRSRVLTLIDCQFAVTGQPCAIGQDNNFAVLSEIAGRSYALMIEKVKDVVTVTQDAIKPARKLDRRWSAIVSGVVEIDGKLVMILSPDLLLMPKTALAA
jgi:purine-binding chemotaxis protein CheW